MLPLTVGHKEVSLSYDNKLMSRVVMPAAGLSEASILYITALVYFFSMASSAWWVILSFTWFLSAGLKWA